MLNYALRRILVAIVLVWVVATIIFSLLHVIPGGEFVPYAAIDPSDVDVVPPRATGPLRILHAPTNRLVKGTDHVIAAVEALRDRFDFEFRIVGLDRAHQRASDNPGFESRDFRDHPLNRQRP